MKVKFFLLLFFLSAGFFLQAQTSYTTHRVQKGETLFGIAKQYNISEEDISKLNPEVALGLRENSVLIIPVSLQSDAGNEKISFKEHKVKRKETIFGIATDYGVTVDDIRKYNKHLYSQELKKGETILIPVKTTTIVSSQQGSSENLPAGKHLVQSKETKYGIARQYGITVEELEALNPAIYGTDALPMGIVLNVPTQKEENTSEENSQVIEKDPNYEYYTIKPKEGFYRMKVLFGLSEEEIIALNPHAKDGLKAGMVLKIPKKEISFAEESISNPFEKYPEVYLENRLKNFDTKNVVVFLPLQLNRIEKDSVAATENLLQNSASLRISVEFYKGVLLAAEFAKQKGISTNLYVFDYQEVGSNVNTFFDSKNIKDVDLVIGPLHQADVEKVSSGLEKKNIPVLSPLSNRQGKIYDNFIHSIPSNTVLEDSMIEFIKNNQNGKNVVLICDNKKGNQKRKLTDNIPGLKVLDAGSENFVRNDDISSLLSKTSPNWVILETDKAILVSSVVNSLHNLNKDYKTRLFTLDKNDAFDFREVSNMHLAGLNFTFAAVQKPNTDYSNAFFTAYKDLYKSYPNRFAVRGFDVTYDALLRLGFSDNIFETNQTLAGETVYIENKFNYVENPGGGYKNIAAYILQYTPELDIIEAE
ncbi:MAG TPA: LysM peptidoglycan-binding domain-containing protein [Flavobacteriaceae bacterium]|nr:LysM peptidoglycan-binding domain-containing protein [Flavobacteriaceae bacterium]